MAPHNALKDQLFEEMKGRIVKDDSSVPVKDGKYWYMSEVAGDNEYAFHYRAGNAEMQNKQLLQFSQLLKNHESLQFLLFSDHLSRSQP